MRESGRRVGLPAEFQIADVDDQVIRPLVASYEIIRLEFYDVFARSQFRGTLFGLDHILHLELLHTTEGLEQLNRYLRQLSRCTALEVIRDLDIRVHLAFVLMIVVVVFMIMFSFLFVIVIVIMVVVFVFDQLRGNLHIFHLAARIGIEPEQPVPVLQYGYGFIDCRMIGLR